MLVVVVVAWLLQKDIWQVWPMLVWFGLAFLIRLPFEENFPRELNEKKGIGKVFSITSPLLRTSHVKNRTCMT